MSATKRQAAQRWLDSFDLEEVSIPNKTIEEYQAFVRVQPVSVLDPVVSKYDSIISLVTIDTMRKIREMLTGEFLIDPEIDPENLVRQASRVIEGKRTQVYFPHPINRRFEALPGSNLYILLGRFIKAYSYRLFLYEGRL